MNFNLQYKKNTIVTYYDYWARQNGKYRDVLLIEFVKFWSQYNSKKGTLIPHSTKYKASYIKEEELEEMYYIAEVWVMQDLKTGKVFEGKMRHIIERNNTDDNSSIKENKNPINDYFEPNPIMDSLEECRIGVIMRNKYPNRLLQLQQERLNQLLTNLNNLIKETKDTTTKKGLFLMLRHRQTPCLRTKRILEQWIRDNPDINLTTLIENERSTDIL
jgi:hypothetical protein